MNLSYTMCGEGRDLVMLHGYLSRKESFLPQITYFRQFYRVTALDFPGMGEAGELPAAWSVDDYADWTENALSRLGICRPLLLAHSFGGRVAVKLLSRGLDCGGAVLVGCAGIVPRRTLCYRMRVGCYRLVKKIAPAYAERRFGSAEYRSLSPVMRESFKRIVNEDLREDAKRIRCPVLFVYGENDRETPLSSAQIYRACVPNAKLAVLAHCGHFAHLDDPLAFQLAAEEFYNAV